MPTDVTAEMFREAADGLSSAYWTLNPFLKTVEELLLAAAEQREQLDRIMASSTPTGGKEFLAGWKKGHAEGAQQIATLTAERDQARATLAQALTLSEAKGQIDTFTLRRLLEAPTRPA